MAKCELGINMQTLSPTSCSTPKTASSFKSYLCRAEHLWTCSCAWSPFSSASGANINRRPRSPAVYLGIWISAPRVRLRWCDLRNSSSQSDLISTHARSCALSRAPLTHTTTHTHLLVGPPTPPIPGLTPLTGANPMILCGVQPPSDPGLIHISGI